MNVCVPAARPVIVWVPLAAEVFRLGPLTATDVALTLDHVMFDEPGAVVEVGDALIDALTTGAAVTVTLADWVTGPPLP